MYLVKSVFNAPVPVYCLAQKSALSAHTNRMVSLWEYKLIEECKHAVENYILQ